MKFVVSSKYLLTNLQGLVKVVSSKNTLPVLDNFLFSLSGNNLRVTASDLEITATIRMDIDGAPDDSMAIIPAKLLLSTLKELDDEPVVIEVDSTTYKGSIKTEDGLFCFMSGDYNDFPKFTESGFKNNVVISSDVLTIGISQTIFAAGIDELRPIFSGVLLDMKPGNTTFVATDAHKLALYEINNGEYAGECQLVLPRKTAMVLQTLLDKLSFDVSLKWDDKECKIEFGDVAIRTRLVEGTFPNYRAVLPHDRSIISVVNRKNLLDVVKRVSLYSNKAADLLKMSFKLGLIEVSSQDIDLSISATEKIGCNLDGDSIDIGFKSSYIREILSRVKSTNIQIEMNEPNRAAIFIPDEEEEGVHYLNLLMPMMIS